MGQVRPRVSYADLERAPEDGRRYELYDGEVYVVPAPFPLHQVVQHALTEVLCEFCRHHGGFAVDAAIDIIFSEHDVLQPDIVFFTPARAHLVDLHHAIRHAPDLCVEILSPSTEAVDRGRKMQAFARFGVREYWIVNPDARAIEVYRLADGSYAPEQVAAGEETLVSPTIEGLSFQVARVFP